MIQFRPARPSDIPFLLALRERTMRPHLERAGMAWEHDAQLARVTTQFEHAAIIMIDGVDAGLLKLDKSRMPWELVQIQMDPAFQRKGHGEAIVRTVLDDAKRAGSAVRLGVLKANPARRLYERLGFRVTDEDDESYSMLADGHLPLVRTAIRMLHHVSFAVADLDLSARFYDAVLAPLGYVRAWSDTAAIGYGLPSGGDQFAIKLRGDGLVVPSEGFHLAFSATTHDAVVAFHRAALQHGGRDNGPPGLRPHYGPGYFAAFVLDPDGYRIEAVVND
jgi:catechol 2,3-dioxygenase-like lactoylglutathione lyase family enzyme/ribosomal protein S18 acetylase RimI-like enzyme